MASFFQESFLIFGYDFSFKNQKCRTFVPVGNYFFNYFVLLFYGLLGQHYWYNLTTEMPCDDFWPMFLLYNGQELDALGWNFKANYESLRYEHPTADVNGESYCLNLTEIFTITTSVNCPADFSQMLKGSMQFISKIPFVSVVKCVRKNLRK